MDTVWIKILNPEAMEINPETHAPGDVAPARRRDGEWVLYSGYRVIDDWIGLYASILETVDLPAEGSHASPDSQAPQDAQNPTPLEAPEAQAQASAEAPAGDGAPSRASWLGKPTPPPEAPAAPVGLSLDWCLGSAVSSAANLDTSGRRACEALEGIRAALEGIRAALEGIRAALAPGDGAPLLSVLDQVAAVSETPSAGEAPTARGQGADA